MEIDLIVNKTKYRTGLSGYASNLKKELSKKVKINEIDTKKNMPKIILTIGKFFHVDLGSAFSTVPLTVKTGKNRVVHLTSQYFAFPLVFHKRKSIVTVHDIILFERSARHSLLMRILLKLDLYGLKKASRIIADSEYTKKKIVEMISYPANRIEVIYLGVDKKEFRPLKTKREPFTILYVGSEMPRKNLSVLIKAFARLKKRIPKAKMVKIGVPQWPGSREGLMDLASDLGVLDSITFKDYTDNLALEYSKATVFVHPSLYEGFGLPVLEAMACGCPVICSDKTSLPEVAGDAAIYFDGYGVDDLAEKMHKVLTDRKLQESLRKRGFERARKFTWEKTARETLEVYKRL